MTAAVTGSGGHLGAPRGARTRATVGLFYSGLLGGVTLARAASVDNIIRVGEEEAAHVIVLSGVVIVLALLIFMVRQARLGVDEDGLTWGWGDLSFRLRRERIVACRVYRDAVAVILKRGSTWYLSRRDYTPYERLVGALRRARLPVEDQARRTPLRARLQAYGVALDVLLVVDTLGATFLFLVA